MTIVKAAIPKPTGDIQDAIAFHRTDETSPLTVSHVSSLFANTPLVPGLVVISLDGKDATWMNPEEAMKVLSTTTADKISITAEGFVGKITKFLSNEKLGLVLNQSNKNSIYIGKIEEDSIFKGTDLSEGMKVITINGAPCPDSASKALKVMKSTVGTLKVVAVNMNQTKPKEEKADKVIRKKKVKSERKNKKKAKSEAKKGTAIAPVAVAGTTKSIKPIPQPQPQDNRDDEEVEPLVSGHAAEFDQAMNELTSELVQAMGIENIKKMVEAAFAEIFSDIAKGTFTTIVGEIISDIHQGNLLAIADSSDEEDEETQDADAAAENNRQDTTTTTNTARDAAPMDKPSESSETPKKKAKSGISKTKRDGPLLAKLGLSKVRSTRRSSKEKARKHIPGSINHDDFFESIDVNKAHLGKTEAINILVGGIVDIVKIVGENDGGAVEVVGELGEGVEVEHDVNISPTSTNKPGQKELLRQKIEELKAKVAANKSRAIEEGLITPFSMKQQPVTSE